MDEPSLPILLPAWLARAAISRADLARAVGVDASQITRWCAGPARPDGAVLPAICSALALSHREAVMLYEAAGVALAPELRIGEAPS